MFKPPSRGPTRAAPRVLDLNGRTIQRTERNRRIPPPSGEGLITLQTTTDVRLQIDRRIRAGQGATHGQDGRNNIQTRPLWQLNIGNAPTRLSALQIDRANHLLMSR